MQEAPVEWITTIGESVAHKVAKYLFLALAIVMLFFAFAYLSILPLFVMVVLIILFIVFIAYAYVEYAFTLVDDDMRIAVVYNRSRRKLKWEFTLGQVERMVPRVDDYSNPKFLCPRNGEPGQYTIIIHEGEERTSLVIEPPEEFVAIMRRRRILL